MADFFSAACAILSVLSAIVSWRAARAANHELASLEADIHSHELALKSLRDSQTSQAETMEQLANRVKMQRVRNAVNHVGDRNGSPDPYRDPNGWRAEMNRNLALGRLSPK